MDASRTGSSALRLTCSYEATSGRSTEEAGALVDLAMANGPA